MSRLLAFVSMLTFACSAQAAAPFVPDDGRYDDPLPAGARARLGTRRFTAETVALSPDGTILARLHQGKVFLTEVRTGRNLREWKPAIKWVRTLRFADGGRLLFVTGSDDVVLEVWDTKSGKTLDKVEGKDVEQTQSSHFPSDFLSEDGKRFAVLSHDNGRQYLVTVWQRRPLKLVRKVNPAHRRTAWAKLSGDGRSLLTGGDANEKDPLVGVVQVWDLETGKDRRLEVGTSDNQWNKAISPDGKLVAAVRDKDVRVWDVVTAKVLCTIDHDRTYEDCLSFSDDGKRLLILGSRFRVHDPRTGKKLGDHARPYRNPNAHIRVTWADVIFPPGDSRPAVAMDRRGQRTRELWDLRTGEAINAHPGHGYPVTALAFTPDGKSLLSGDDQAHVFRWDLATGRPDQRYPTQRISGDRYSRPGLSFAPGGGQFVVPERRLVHLYDVAQGKVTRRLPWPSTLDMDWCPTAFSSDGRRCLIEAHDDGNRDRDVPCKVRAEVLDLTTGRAEFSHSFDKVIGLAAAFSPDDTRLVLRVLHKEAKAEERMELSCWDWRKGKLLRSVRLPGDSNGSLLVAADGTSAVVIAGTFPGRLIEWDLKVGRVLRQVERPWGYLESELVASPDRRTFALATSSKEESAFRVYEWATLTERFVFVADDAVRGGLAYSPDGKTLAGGCDSGIVYLWDLAGDRGPRPWEKKPSAADSLWQRLLVHDAKAAWPAMRELLHRPEAAVRLFGQKQKKAVAAKKPEAKDVARLIEQLDAEDADRREEASAELSRVARLVQKELREALQTAKSVEDRRRLLHLVKSTEGVDPEEVRQIRLVEILERIGSAQARSLLEDYAKGEAKAALTREATAALKRMR